MNALRFAVRFVAGSAPPVASVPARVGDVPWMTVRAMRARPENICRRDARGPHPAADVFQMRHSLKVVRVDTPSVATNVIDLFVDRDRPNPVIVRDTMRESFAALIVKLRIAAIIVPTRPQPARPQMCEMRRWIDAPYFGVEPRQLRFSHGGIIA